MKKLYILLLIAPFIKGCKEIPPNIDFSARYECDVPYTVQQDRHVLIEEFTGVRCVNCPAGATQIQNIVNGSNGHVIPISVHAGFFSQTYPTSVQDLSFADRAAFINLLGDPIGYPAAMIDRKVFSNTTSRIQSQGAWSGSINSELTEPPLAAVEIQNMNYNSTTRELTFSVDVNCYDDIFKDIALSAAILEDSIVTTQLTPSGQDPNYIHRHVLRKILPNVQGGAIPSLPYMQTFSVILDPLWVSEKCIVVAFIHYNDTANSDFNVLQAEEAHVH